MKKVIINNRVYQMEKKKLKGLFDIGKKYVSLGIYAVEKDNIIENLKKSLSEKNLVIDNLKDNLNETTNKLSNLKDLEDIELEKDLQILDLEEEIENLKAQLKKLQ